MRARLSAAVVMLTVSLLPCQADQDDLSQGVFIPHAVPEMSFTADPPPGGWCQAYLEHAIHSHEDQINSMAGPLDNVMWFILSAWEEDKRWSAVEFGFLDYNPDLFAIYDYGPCYPATGGIEISTLNWPGPNGGTALAWSSLPWTGNYAPVYYFAGYVYAPSFGQTVIPLGLDPATGFCGWAGVPVPPQEYAPVCLGALGINTVGEACQPAVVQPERSACCLPSGACVILSEDPCLAGGGEWLAGTPGCDPDPCLTLPDERACCLPGGACLVLDSQACQNLGGRWLPGALSCLPDPCGEVYVVCPDGSGDFPTIQSAIDTAPDGTIIELTDGTFTGVGNRDIDLRGKTLTVRSQRDMPALCTIDCQHAGRAFIFDSNEGPATCLRGVSVTNGHMNYGAAILAENASPTIVNCVFTYNEAVVEGGALACRGSLASIQDCAFIANYAGVAGGALYLQESSARVENCVFQDNAAGTGGALTAVTSPYPVIHGCTFCGNAVLERGGAILFTLANSPRVENCTFSDNSGPWGGGGIHCDYASPHLYNTVVAFSAQGAAITVNDPGQSHPTLWCCDLFGNAGGDWVGAIAPQLGQNGNIRLDPLFWDRANRDFRLRPSSPCAPFSPPNAECDLIGAWPVVDPQRVPREAPAASRAGTLTSSPNPFRETAQVRYELPGITAQHVRLAVHDPEGRVVRILTDDIQPAGVHTSQWDGCDQDGRQAPRGIYYLRLQADEVGAIKPLILLR